MSENPFADLTRKQAWQGRLGRWRDTWLRPVRPSRLRPDRPGPSNLLLLGVDTLRRDHLGFLGYSSPTSPHLDGLAATGTVFTDVTAPAPWTLPSFAGALTGLMPGLHGARLAGPMRHMEKQPPGRLDPGVITLATHLRRQGYRTAAFYSNQFFAFGLAESFDRHHYLNLPAADLARYATEWIRRHADRPFFCFVLFNDPHEPTTPPAADLSEFLPRARAAGAQAETVDLRLLARWGEDGPLPLGRIPAGEEESPAVRAALALKIALYDATIRAVDRAIGGMQEQLRRWDLARSTVVSVFADHGEEFTDHLDFARNWDHDPRDLRAIGHGHSHFQELLHVPWAAWGPGVPAGVRRDEPVSLCDLGPTLADWLDVKPLHPAAPSDAPADLAGALTGRSLAHAGPDPETTGERLLLAEDIAYGPDLVALRQGKWKWIAHRDGRGLALFDLAADPGEKQDVAAEHPQTVAAFAELLRAWRETENGAGDRGAKTPGQDPPRSWDDLDDTVRQRLKDLGYTE